jgi:hypothetical protein
MTLNIDFPASPSEGDIVAGGDKVWQYVNGSWVLIKYQAADSGIMDAGSPSGDTRIRVNGGNHSSVFSSSQPVNGGTA